MQTGVLIRAALFPRYYLVTYLTDDMDRALCTEQILSWSGTFRINQPIDNLRGDFRRVPTHNDYRFDSLLSKAGNNLGMRSCGEAESLSKHISSVLIEILLYNF